MGSRKHVGFTKLHLVSCAVFLIVLSGLAPLLDAAAPVRLGGRVQWIAGGKMAMIPDSGKVSVTVDLTRVPVDQYQGLKQGDGVIVEGGWGDRVPTSVPPRGPSPYPPDPR